MDQWSLGQITEVDYRESDWAPGRVAPYRVELLDKNDIVIVPKDEDEVCRRLPASRSPSPWWCSLYADRPGSYFARGGLEAVDDLKRDSQGQDINEQDLGGETALSMAVPVCWLAGVRELAAMGADFNCSNDAHQTPLHLAMDCPIRQLEMTTLLIDAGADVSLQDLDSGGTDGTKKPHRTPLHYSAALGLAPVVAKLIEAKAPLDLQDAQRRAPLHLSISEGHSDVTDLLLRAGADVNVGAANPARDLSLLSKAVYENESSFAQRLILARAAVNHAGKQGMTALHFAARNKSAEMARLLLDAGADPLLKCSFGTAGEMATKNGATEVVALLQKSMAAVENNAHPEVLLEDAVKREQPKETDAGVHFFVNGRCVSQQH